MQDFLLRHQLPKSFSAQADAWYKPLIDELQPLLGHRNRSFVLGINGTQGSGKSTLADFIASTLNAQGYRVANLSIDDFYLLRSERERLAAEVHPLLLSRGVPGTHDLGMLHALLDRLTHAAPDEQLAIPRFDKARDDRLPENEWSQISGPIDLVILEGWCVGAKPQQAQPLIQPINDLEEREDADGSWRRYVNAALQDYQSLFARIDRLVMLKAPAFANVYRWRRLQEAKLASATASSGVKNRIMSEDELTRFIQHFQRVTQEMLRDLPPRADSVFFLDDEQRVCARRIKAEE